MMSRRGLPVMLLLAVLTACAQPVGIDDAGAVVTLGEPDRFYASSGPLTVTATVYNPGSVAIDAGTAIVDGSHIELRRLDGKPLGAPWAGSTAAPPTTIAAGERARLNIELRDLFPTLNTPGKYTVTVVLSDSRSNTVPLVILPVFRTDADYRAEVKTDRGTIVLRFFPDVAPEHVKNFVDLARSGFYDGILFHRILRDLMIQAGDPTRSGRGGPGYHLRGEFSDRPHVRGTLSMSREGDDPNSAGSQWFICLDRVEDWDRIYTVFGEVESGIDVASAIGHMPVDNGVPQEAVVIESITISEASER